MIQPAPRTTSNARIMKQNSNVRKGSEYILQVMAAIAHYLFHYTSPLLTIKGEHGPLHKLKMVEEPIGSMPQFFCVRRHLIKSKGFQWSRMGDKQPQAVAVKKGTASATRFLDIANHLIKLSHKVTYDSLRLFVPAPRST